MLTNNFISLLKIYAHIDGVGANNRDKPRAGIRLKDFFKLPLEYEDKIQSLKIFTTMNSTVACKLGSFSYGLFNFDKPYNYKKLTDFGEDNFDKNYFVKPEITLLLGKSNKKESKEDISLDLIDNYTSLTTFCSNNEKSYKTWGSTFFTIGKTIQNDTEEDIIIKELGIFFNLRSFFYYISGKGFITDTKINDSGEEELVEIRIDTINLLLPDCPIMIAREVLPYEVVLKPGEMYTFTMSIGA